MMKFTDLEKAKVYADRLSMRDSDWPGAYSRHDVVAFEEDGETSYLVFSYPVAADFAARNSDVALAYRTERK